MDYFCEGVSSDLARRKIFCVLSPALGAFFLIFLLGGCVRVAGTAGYWKTGEDSETTAKRATFDTADYVSRDPSPGSIDF
jgi:hypothetical protein